LAEILKPFDGGRHSPDGSDCVSASVDDLLQEAYQELQILPTAPQSEEG
jgi:hypothetical protein